MVFVQNNISSLCRSFINSVKRSQTLKVLNLAKNKIQRVPKSLQNLFSLEQLWLGGNPFHCDCDMEWMIHWINNFNSTSISHIIMDIDNIRCRSGNWIEEQISQLTPADFGKIGCYSWTKVQKISVGIASIVVVLLIAGSVYATKRHHELKFYLFYYFKMDTIPKDDPSEDLTNIEYDAFFCFWWVVCSTDLGFSVFPCADISFFSSTLCGASIGCIHPPQVELGTSCTLVMVLHSHFGCFCKKIPSALILRKFSQNLFFFHDLFFISVKKIFNGSKMFSWTTSCSRNLILKETMGFDSLLPKETG